MGRPGTDFAGEVVAVGASVSAFKVGDAVFGAVRGALSEFVAVKAARIALKPATATFEEAGALALAGVTALQAVRDVGAVHGGQQVLVVGAAGGVGSFVVQMAKAFGATVTAVTSTDKLAAIASLGADRVLAYTGRDFLDGTVQYDVIADCSGVRSLRDFRRALTPDGRFVGIGANPNRMLMLVPRLLTMMILSRLTPRKMRFFMARADSADLGVLKQMVEAGSVRPLVPRVFAFAEVVEAMRHFQSGRAVGKVVISVP
jgi:NADPH:quinone reductase-like Zn-dependent oxidoreductase